jgi:hypothetical protein
MLTFTLYPEGGAVHIDPRAVAAVVETERHPRGAAPRLVAVITLAAGGEHVVEDGPRTAARLIREAKADAGR